MKSRWLGMGPRTRQLEEDIKKFTNSQDCVVVNNGTSALITALLANGVKPNDEVLVPTYTFIATVNSVLAIGAKPVLIDCDPQTFNISEENIKDQLSQHPRSRALLFVDVAGMPANIDNLRELGESNNLILIEDAAESFGAEYKDRVLGNYDHTTIFSFHIAKQTTMVEGGAIVSNNPEISERCRLIRSHGEGKEKYIHIEVGLNFRPTDLQSAIGIVQLKKVEAFISLRQKIAELYKSRLTEYLSFQHIPSYVKRHPYMLFLALAANRTDRDNLVKHLNDAGIDTRIPWPPVHRQPYHKQRLGDYYCPAADKIYERVISLPIGNAMAESDAKIVIESVKEFYNKC